MLLPSDAEHVVQTRWPDYLDYDVVRHSDLCYTVVLMDLDYHHYTFRLNLSLDGRWTVVPVSGFCETEGLIAGLGWLRGGST